MNILFICTHNRCRSVLAEAITRRLAGPRIQVASAGSEPADAVHPLTLKYLAERGYDTEGLRSKSWNDLDGFTPDVVITVCDSAARESCPVWLTPALKVHWGLADPSRIEGDEVQQAIAFGQIMDTLERRVRALAKLPLDDLSREKVKEELEKLGDLN